MSPKVQRCRLVKLPGRATDRVHWKSRLAGTGRGLWRGSSLLAATLLLVLASHPQAEAIDYRKCNLKIVVSGDGLAETKVDGAEFWAWARATSPQAAWSAINADARSCASAVVRRDANTLPSNCAPNETILKGGGFGSGITGLATPHVHTLVKETICSNHVRAEAGNGHRTTPG